MIKYHAKNEPHWLYVERKRYQALRDMRVNHHIDVTPQLYPTLVSLHNEGLIKFNRDETSATLTVAGLLEANRIGLR
jgi:DNA-binding PadR family transcriptional regulator